MVVTVLLLLCGAASLAEAPLPSLPKELAHLEAVFENEALLAERLRAFDRHQTALAEWDAELAKDLQRSKETALAKETMQRARSRIVSLGQAYEAAAGRYPNNARIQTYYGEYLYDQMGDVPKALRTWKLAAALDSQLSAPLNNMAIHYCHVGDYDRGLNYFDQAIELEPDNPDYLFNLCQIYMVHFPVVQHNRKWDRSRVYKEAMKLSKKAAEFSGGDFELLQDYAVNFFAAEEFGAKSDWGGAAKAWKAARGLARTKDDRFYTWLNEGRVRLREGRRSDARACFKEALALHPESAIVKELLEKASASRKP